jgi:hypothetical protein
MNQNPVNPKPIFCNNPEGFHALKYKIKKILNKLIFQTTLGVELPSTQKKKKKKKKI